ncbi:MAG TPA: hypothetical protein VMR95_01125 [Candidatus Binatia bacterium]|jgi:hypothetical protein|nr:hypothetical protein [Candidatus Binatia bacterium]
MTKPAILVPDNAGIHNASDYATRLEKQKTYRDLSTVIVCPTRGLISARIVQSWQGLIRPMNQKVLGPIFMEGMEVGEAYNQVIKMILENPELKKFKFMLTLEEDNAPPPDGLLKLYESIDEYDAVGGLYWTKGEGGQPMCYGDPRVMPLNFIPQVPQSNAVNPCNGLGMGFTLFRLQMLKDKRFDYGNWFKTKQEVVPGGGVQVFTQDLWFFQKALEFGYRFACDTNVKVGHYDATTQLMW